MDKMTLGEILEKFQNIFNRYFAAEIAMTRSAKADKDKATLQAALQSLNESLIMFDECLFTPDNYNSFANRFVTNTKFRVFIRRLHRAFITYGLANYGDNFPKHLQEVIAKGCSTVYVTNDYTPVVLGANAKNVLTLTAENITGMIQAIPESLTAHLATSAIVFYLNADIKPEEFLRSEFGTTTHPSETLTKK